MALQTIALAESYAEALSRVTGTPAVARHSANYSTVTFADPVATQRWIEKQLRLAPPGDVRVDFGPAVYPVAIRAALPWALGILALGWIVGKNT